MRKISSNEWEKEENTLFEAVTEFLDIFIAFSLVAITILFILSCQK